MSPGKSSNDIDKKESSCHGHGNYIVNDAKMQINDAKNRKLAKLKETREKRRQLNIKEKEEFEKSVLAVKKRKESLRALNERVQRERESSAHNPVDIKSDILAVKSKLLGSARAETGGARDVNFQL